LRLIDGFRVSLVFLREVVENTKLKVFKNKGSKNAQILSISLEKTQKKAFVNQQTLQLLHQYITLLLKEY
jgi:hypothetical protein